MELDEGREEPSLRNLDKGEKSIFPSFSRNSSLETRFAYNSNHQFQLEDTFTGIMEEQELSARSKATAMKS